MAFNGLSSARRMPTARRVTESELFLRADPRRRWRYDMFAGADTHGATLGILGMGRIGQGIARRGAASWTMRFLAVALRDKIIAATGPVCMAVAVKAA